MQLEPLTAWITVPVAAGAFLFLNWMERRRSLRRHVESKLRREARNLAVAAMSGVAVLLLEMPAMLFLGRIVAQRGGGMLQMLALPRWLEVSAALVLMDYTFYLWHILMHRVSFLWRFHVVHHADLDMDASTALRFHFGEQLISMPWRAAQVSLIGLTPLTFSIWQVAFLLSILFHHSEVNLPVEWERRVNWFIVTPRMHGIHHSIVRQETDSNWSSGLTLWDRMHGTLRLNVAQAEISIGVPAWRDPDSVTLPNIVKIPFLPLPRVWQFPGNGEPEPRPATGERNQLRA